MTISAITGTADRALNLAASAPNSAFGPGGRGRLLSQAAGLKLIENQSSFGQNLADPLVSSEAGSKSLANVSFSPFVQERGNLGRINNFQVTERLASSLGSNLASPGAAGLVTNLTGVASTGLNASIIDGFNAPQAKTLGSIGSGLVFSDVASSFTIRNIDAFDVAKRLAAQSGIGQNLASFSNAKNLGSTSLGSLGFSLII